jgi:DNA-binding protein YbaB
MSGNIISTSAHYHWVKKIVASTNGDGVLKLTIEGDQSVSNRSFNQAEILIFTDDVALTERLIKAINDAAAELTTEVVEACW